MRGNCLKLHQGRLRLAIRKHSFSERAVRHRVPREVMQWSLEVFWKHVDVALSDVVGEHSGMGGRLDGFTDLF